MNLENKYKNTLITPHPETFSSLTVTYTLSKNSSNKYWMRTRHIMQYWVLNHQGYRTYFSFEKIRTNYLTEDKGDNYNFLVENDVLDHLN